MGNGRGYVSSPSFRKQGSRGHQAVPTCCQDADAHPRSLDIVTWTQGFQKSYDGRGAVDGVNHVAVMQMMDEREKGLY